jgi:hypothetical protein
MELSTGTFYNKISSLPFGNQLAKASVKVQAKSPEILLATGIVSIIGGTVLACKATVSAQEVLAEHQKMRNDVDEAARLGANNEVSYSEEDRKKDLVTVYAKTSVGLAKTYAPAAALIGLGIFALLASHGIMAKRNVAIVAAYDTVKTGFDAYRKRVVEEFGDEVDKKLRFGLQDQKVTEVVTDEDGKEHKTKVTKTAFDPNEVSTYARWFSAETSREFWNRNPSMNLTTLKAKESYFNNVLSARGFVFLNEVYDGLGFPMTPEGQQVGWMKNDDGDNFIDFGILESRNMLAVNGQDPDGINAYLLDFNVDGPIMYKI